MSLSTVHQNYITGSYASDVQFLLKIAENNPLRLNPTQVNIEPEIDSVKSLAIGYGYDLLKNAPATVIADLTATSRPASWWSSWARRGGGKSTLAKSQDMSFKALIELREQQLNANGLALSLAAGMQVTAEIIQGKRTVLEYLLSPVQRVASEAAMER